MSINSTIATGSATLLGFSDQIAPANTFIQIVVAIITSGIVSIFASRYFERINERRKLYANAYKTALAWQEMLYRVRRRGKDLEGERKIIEKFHDVQEEINYYQGLVSFESDSLGKSYEKLISQIKKKNVQLIQEAWKKPIRRPRDGILKTDEHPDTLIDAKSFLRDTRDWSSLWQWPKLRVLWKNRGKK